MKIELNETEITGYILDGLRNQGISISGVVDVDFTSRRQPPGIAATLSIGEDAVPEEDQEEDTDEREEETTSSDVSDPFNN